MLCPECDTKLDGAYCSKCDVDLDTCSWCGAITDGEFGIESCCQMCKAD